LQSAREFILVGRYAAAHIITMKIEAMRQKYL